MIACIFQGQAFSISIQLGDHSKGDVGDPEFYNALQTFLMQTLALSWSQLLLSAPMAHDMDFRRRYY